MRLPSRGAGKQRISAERLLLEKRGYEMPEEDLTDKELVNEMFSLPTHTLKEIDKQDDRCGETARYLLRCQKVGRGI